MSLDNIFKIIQICAAFSVGGAAVWVSILQYKSNKLKLKLELYERRINILSLTQEYLGDFLNSRDFDLQTPLTFRGKVTVAKFLFGDDVYSKVEELFKKGLKLDLLNTKIQMKNEGETINGNPVQDRLALRKEVSAEYDAIMELFYPYLDLSKG